MTSSRRIEANRRNATRSTGPTTEAGKHRSRRNAVRHGLCAETVVKTVEDIHENRGFEAAVIADYDARAAVERELVLRLASLLWRLRRATAIETDLLRIQTEVVRDRRNHRVPDWLPNIPSPIPRLTPHRITDTEGLSMPVARGRRSVIPAVAHPAGRHNPSALPGECRMASFGWPISTTECLNGSVDMNQRLPARLYKRFFCCNQCEFAEQR
jgi:hypothetical protein